MKCSVCRNHCEPTAHSCSVCGFDRINMDFLNVDDAEAWKKSVKFAKNVWFMSETYDDFKHFNPKCNTIERTLLQLNTYFNYDEQLEYIRRNPNDFTARSWFIDCLREIYVLGGTYPLTSRKYVKGVIEDHMSFFERADNGLGSKREYVMCEHLIHRAEMALADCDFTTSFRYYQQYLFEIRRLKENDYLASIEDAARCVLHNCQTLCELLAVDIGICDSIEKKHDEYYNHDVYKTSDARELLQRIKERERRSLHIHTLGCGLYGAYYTEKDDSWTDIIGKQHEATFKTCTTEFRGTEHFYAYDLSSLGCGLVSVERISGLMHRIEYVTDAFSVSDAIYMHRDAVERLARRLISIQGLFD